MVKKLRDECLVCIGKNLHCIKRVGKFLPTVVKEDLIQWLAFHDMLTEEYLPHVTYNLFSKTLRHVDLYKCNQINDGFLKKLAESGCQLSHLVIHGCQEVTGTGIHHITYNQKDLEDLELRKLPKLSDAGLSHVFSEKLRKLDLRECTNIGAEGVNHLLMRNKQVKELILSGCSKLDYSVFTSIAQNLGPSLQKLDIVDLHFLSDASLIEIAERCVNLESMDLSGCNRISKQSIMKLCQHCCNLRSLDLSYCKLEGPGNADCLNMLPASLKELSLCGVRVDDQQQLVDCLKRLVSLQSVRLCGVPALSDQSLTEALSIMGSQLERLDVSGSVISQLTDDGVASIAKYCLNLEDLSLSLLPHITGVSLIPMLQDDSRATSIKVLRLSNKKLEEEVLHAVACHCVNLEFLNVGGVTCVDDQLLCAFARNCPHLRSVNLKGCKMVTDVGICELARCCPLKVLVAAGLHQLTDKTIFALASSCTDMEELYLNGCAKVSPVALVYFQDCCMQRVYVQHKIPNAAPNQLMAKNLDTGEFCRADLLQTS